jgi:hypothetical protein
MLFKTSDVAILLRHLVCNPAADLAWKSCTGHSPGRPSVLLSNPRQRCGRWRLWHSLFWCASYVECLPIGIRRIMCLSKHAMMVVRITRRTWQTGMLVFGQRFAGSIAMEASEAEPCLLNHVFCCPLWILETVCAEIAFSTFVPCALSTRPLAQGARSCQGRELQCGEQYVSLPRSWLRSNLRCQLRVSRCRAVHFLVTVN